MRTRKHAVLAASALFAATLIGTASPAQATPTGCTTGRDGKTAWAYCSGGDGNYAVKIYVTSPNPMVGSWPEHGPCVSPGQRSEYTPYHNIPFTVSGIAYC
ncbi:hypothetical protein GCM10022419_061580 [Nonomuraea rosea]|uniref:Secreted protein n=1 Tax=Nonomuraea rosea TaxID=638574 RepID=A0ABP6XTU5_9ACTN